MEHKHLYQLPTYWSIFERVHDMNALNTRPTNETINEAAKATPKPLQTSHPGVNTVVIKETTTPEIIQTTTSSTISTTVSSTTTTTPSTTTFTTTPPVPTTTTSMLHTTSSTSPPHSLPSPQPQTATTTTAPPVLVQPCTTCVSPVLTAPQPLTPLSLQNSTPIPQPQMQVTVSTISPQPPLESSVPPPLKPLSEVINSTHGDTAVFLNHSKILTHPSVISEHLLHELNISKIDINMKKIYKTEVQLGKVNGSQSELQQEIQLENSENSNNTNENKEHTLDHGWFLR